MVTQAASRPQVGTADLGGRQLEAFRRIVNGTSLLLFVLVAALAALTFLGPVLGLESFTIRGRSMEPAIPLGAMVIVAPADDLAQGDVITYRATNGVVVTHRIVGFETIAGERHFLTRGDASQADDPTPVDPNAVIGRVERYVPAIGYFSWMLSTGPGLVGVVTALLALVLLQFWLDDEVDLQRYRRAMRAARMARTATTTGQSASPAKATRATKTTAAASSATSVARPASPAKTPAANSRTAKAAAPAPRTSSADKAARSARPARQTRTGSAGASSANTIPPPGHSKPYRSSSTRRAAPVSKTERR